jgi:hypothetical protein
MGTCAKCGVELTLKDWGNGGTVLNGPDGRMHFPDDAPCLRAQLAARDARVKALEAMLRLTLGTVEDNERDIDGGEDAPDLSGMGLYRLGIETAYADRTADEHILDTAAAAIEGPARALLAGAVKEET